jgi:hypothetical protein
MFQLIDCSMLKTRERQMELKMVDQLFTVRITGSWPSSFIYCKMFLKKRRNGVS